MQKQDLITVQEILEDLIPVSALLDKLQDGKAIILKGRDRNVAVGEGLLVKVNASIGASHSKSFKSEMEKLKLLSSVGYRPDTLMDLSIIRVDKPLYLYAMEMFGGPVGTLPHYLCYQPQKGIDVKDLIDEIEKQAEMGVSLMTLHLTPRKYLYEKACKTRVIPVVSRGGGIIIRDMYINDRTESLLSLYFDEILRILKRHNVALSIGTAFRPGTTVDALDEVQLEEIKIQGEYINAARKAGVSVMMEGIGHATLDKIASYIKIVKTRYGVPVMPLGPIPTDAAVGEDHIASAIGATYMAFLNGADIINSITREEHTGGIPTLESVLEGLKAARIAAHVVNIARFTKLDVIDRQLSEKRGVHYTCVVEGGLFTESAKQCFSMGCSRCEKECPLRLNYYLNQNDILFPRS